MGPERVLVIDDEPWIAEMLRRVLEDEGYQVDTAENGAVALSRMQEQSYDLIVCDVRMPEMDGRRLYRELERVRPDLLARMVFISGSALNPALEGFVRGTGAPYLRKPFTVQEVRRTTREVLGSGEPAPPPRG
jgi:two-component system NtrC family sensor kinase